MKQEVVKINNDGVCRIHCTVWNRLINDQDEIWKLIDTACSVIAIDEVSMMWCHTAPCAPPFYQHIPGSPLSFLYLPGLPRDALPWPVRPDPALPGGPASHRPAGPVLV